PRLSLAVADVAEFITPGAAYDAILLDVDNGPEGLVQEANDALYKRRGLLDARDALKPGGILAVWSITPNIPFTNRLKRAGFEVEEQIVRSYGTRHVVWLATKAHRYFRAFFQVFFAGGFETLLATSPAFLGDSQLQGRARFRDRQLLPGGFDDVV